MRLGLTILIIVLSGLLVGGFLNSQDILSDNSQDILSDNYSLEEQNIYSDFKLPEAGFQSLEREHKGQTYTIYHGHFPQYLNWSGSGYYFSLGGAPVIPESENLDISQEETEGIVILRASEHLGKKFDLSRDAEVTISALNGVDYESEVNRSSYCRSATLNLNRNSALVETFNITNIRGFAEYRADIPIENRQTVELRVNVSAEQCENDNPPIIVIDRFEVKYR